VISTAKAIVTVKIQKYQKQVKCLVSDTGSVDYILGMNWFVKQQPSIRWEYPRMMTIGNKRSQIAIYDHVKSSNEIADITEISALQFKRMIRKPKSEVYVAFIFLRQDVVPVQRTTIPERVRKLIRQFGGIFKKKLPDKLPPSRAVDYEIELVPNSKPPS
jgi:hypothetical protein